MRYCLKCGNPIENDRFCNKCGADNGEVVQQETQTASPIGAQMPSISAGVILHWASVICFAVASITLLSACLEGSESVCLSSMLLTGTIIPVIGYFVFAMWGTLASVILLLNGKDTSKNTAIGASVIMAAIMIAFAILNLITKNAEGSLRLVTIMYASFRYKLSSIIVFCVLSVASGIAKIRIKDKEA